MKKSSQFLNIAQNKFSKPDNDGFTELWHDMAKAAETDEGDKDISDEEMQRLVDDFIVSRDEWTRTHPYSRGSLQCASDKYYAQLATSLKLSWAVMPLPDEIPDGLLHRCAMTLAAYLEDLVSGIGVWDSIRQLHRSRYGVWLPFFDCEHEEYLLDNVNIEDMKFLIWQTWCRCGLQDEMIYSPFSSAIEMMAEMVFDTLADEFEKAPEAKRVADYMDRIFRSGDFYAVRSLAEWLVFLNPLTAAPDMVDSAVEQMQDWKDDRLGISPDKALYTVFATMSLKCHTGPEGMHASAYLARMCADKGFTQLAEKLEGSRLVPSSAFRLTQVDRKTVTLEDASGNSYTVERISFGKGVDFKSAKGFVTSIVKFGDFWQQNGLAATLTADPFEKEKRLPGFNKSPKAAELADSIAAARRGRRVFFCKDIQQVSELLGLPYRGEKENPAEAPDNFLVLLSSTDGISLLSEYAVAIKDRTNPFYDKAQAEYAGLKLMTSGLVPDDIAAIFQEKKMMPDVWLACSQGKRFGKRLVQDNLRYLFSFYRTDPS